MKIENSKATAYTTAKKRIGCKEPTEVKDLVFIETDFGFKILVTCWRLVLTTKWY